MYQKVTDHVLANMIRNGSKFYRYGKIQRDVLAFWEDDDAEIAKVVDEDGTYSSINSMRTNYAATVKKLGVRIKVLSFDGAVYMVKLK